MKKIIIYIVVTALALLIPERGTDVGRLIPVELVFLYEDGYELVLETDTGDTGKGNTVDEAINNLKQTAPGTVFLDTADYLMVTEDTVKELEAIGTHLKGSVRVCLAEKGIKIDEAAEYLAAHEPKIDIIVAETTEITQKLKQIDGRIILS